jgi:probable HAF family extracellular repeat protein
MSCNPLLWGRRPTSVSVRLSLVELEPRCLLSWSIYDLGTLGGGTSAAYGINDSGQIVGSSQTTGNQYTQAFLYDSGTMSPLYTLNGTTGNSTALGINNSAQTPLIVGSSDKTIDTRTYTHAFSYNISSQVMSDLNTLAGTNGNSTATAVNGANPPIIVGYSTPPSGPAPPLVVGFWDDATTMHELDPFSGGDRSDADGIDNATTPHIVGESRGYTFNCPGNGKDYNVFNAAQWNNFSSTPANLGTLPPSGKVSHAYGVAYHSSDGHTYVVGDSSTDVNTNCGLSPPRAFLREDDGQGGYTFTQLDQNVSGVNQSRALAVNTARQIVGYWGTGTDGTFLDPRAFLYDSTGWHNLNDLLPSGSGWTLTQATGINQSEWIVGFGSHLIIGVLPARVPES